MGTSAPNPRWWTSRWFQLAAGVLVFCELAYWGTKSPNHFSVGTMCCQATRTRHPALPSAYCLRDAGGFKIVDALSDEGEAIRQSSNYPVDLPMLIAFRWWRSTGGVFGPVTTSWDCTLSVSGGDFSDQELAIRALYADWMQREWYWRSAVDQQFVDGLKAGKQRVSLFSPAWVVHDAAMSVLTLLLFSSLVTRPPRLRIPTLQERRRDRGECTACGYSLSGTIRESDGMFVCPECGLRNPPPKSEFKPPGVG